jgi:hypothetical protein
MAWRQLTSKRFRLRARLRLLTAFEQHPVAREVLVEQLQAKANCIGQYFE